MSKTKPIIGISTGDPNGIGVEVILKCFSDKRMFDFMTPVVFSNYELIKAQAVHFNLKVGLNNLSDFKNLKPNSLNIYEASKGNFKLDFGKSEESGGQLSRESLTTASSFLKKKKIDALVTAPINKKNILHESFDFMGHTDFLNKTFDGEAMMFMVSQDLKIALLTEHIPIDKITENIGSQEKLQKTINGYQIINPELKFEKEQHPWEMLFTFNDIKSDFELIMKNWFSNYEHFEAPFNLVLPAKTTAIAEVLKPAVMVPLVPSVNAISVTVKKCFVLVTVLLLGPVKLSVSASPLTSVPVMVKVLSAKLAAEANVICLAEFKVATPPLAFAPLIVNVLAVAPEV